MYFSVEACKPTIEGDKATFRLNLQDIYQCMVTQVRNKATVRNYLAEQLLCKLTQPLHSRAVPCSITALLPSTKLGLNKSFQSNVITTIIIQPRLSRGPQILNFLSENQSKQHTILKDYFLFKNSFLTTLLNI